MQDLLKNDLKNALKAGDSLRVLVLRMLLSEINYKKIDLHRELTDEDILTVMAKEMKKRREAVDSFTSGGRTEQAESEQKEMEILSAYLPKLMSRDEIQTQLLGMDLTGDMGSVMKMIVEKFKGKADMGLVSELVKKKRGK